MLRKIILTAGAALMVATGWLASAPAEAAGVKVGILTCDVDSGWGAILGSSKDLRCSYIPNRGDGEHYNGSITKLGVDIGYTEHGLMVWDVIAPSSDLRAGALEGGYGGVTAGATVGVGGSVNVLVGGFDKSISLQPISVEGNKGLDLAAGIGALKLKFEKR